MTEPMRIHRALARAGVASRRHAEALVAEGRVTVNGVVARVGQSVDPANDRVQVDGLDVALEGTQARWFVLHKPAGVVTTKRDPEGRPTVFSLVPEVPGLTYVGRLDFLTEGVLLLTNDGEGAHRLTHPSAEVERVYVATVRGNAKAAADEARHGVELEDGLATPAWVTVHPLENRRWAFELAIREGRTREVRRLCTALGLEVERLVRTQFGPVRLGALEPGKWRELSPREAAMLEVVTGTAVPAGRPPRRSPARRESWRESDGSPRQSSRGRAQRNEGRNERREERRDGNRDERRGLRRGERQGERRDERQGEARHAGGDPRGEARRERPRRGDGPSRSRGPARSARPARPDGPARHGGEDRHARHDQPGRESGGEGGTRQGRRPGRVSPKPRGRRSS